MAIPKVIYQTFKTADIPLLTKWAIGCFLQRNKAYRYEFYDDKRIITFFEQHFDTRINNAYNRLQIGAAKADFFRYAVLYIYGGIYVDLDSRIIGRLDDFLQESDKAVLAREKKHPDCFVQWALLYDKGHPFLERTMAMVVDNIARNAFPHDVHAMTGPTVYSSAIRSVLEEQPHTSYRLVVDDYKGMMQFKYKLGKLMYGSRAEHWKKMQQRTPVLYPKKI